jgi:curved DNA-binding protein CbpA
MHLKDYYQILELAPSATLTEIKKAYRRLAKQHHPDKTNNDPYASAQFTEIKEAYEVLTNPSKKEYYLQQRWYEQSTGKRKKQDVITPVNILKQALELEKYVSTLDVFRMDKAGLRDYILDLLPGDVIQKLCGFREPETNREIIHTILRAMHPLPKAYTETVIPRLLQLASGDESANRQIQSFLQKAQRKNQRERYSLAAIILLTLVLCLLIWLGGR